MFDWVRNTLLSNIFSRLKATKQRQEHSSRILVDAKAGVEHLVDKLQHIKTPKGQVPQAHLSPTSDEYILELLGERTLLLTEAATSGVQLKKVFLITLLPESRFKAEACKETLAQVNTVNFAKFLRTSFYRTPTGDCFCIEKLLLDKAFLDRHQSGPMKSVLLVIIGRLVGWLVGWLVTQFSQKHL